MQWENGVRLRTGYTFCGAFSTQIHPIISKKGIVGPNYIPISCVKVSHPKKHGPPRSLETFSWHPWHHHAARRCICASWGWVVRCTSMWCWRVPGIFWWPGGWCEQNLCELIAKLYIRICLYIHIYVISDQKEDAKHYVKYVLICAHACYKRVRNRMMSSQGTVADTTYPPASLKVWQQHKEEE